MFQKKDIDVNFDMIIGKNSLLKGDIESEGSIRIDGKIIGNITALGNVIVSENALVRGSISCLSVELYGVCHGDVSVKGKLNLHQNASLSGNVIAKSFSTKEGAQFKGNCTVDPKEELEITLQVMNSDLANPLDHKLIDFSKQVKAQDKEPNEASDIKENKHAK